MTTTFEEISQMLAELGPELDVDEIAAYEDQNSWAIAISDDVRETAMSLDHDEESGKLFMFGELCPPPEEKLLSTYEFLLSYNLACIETGGARMALDSAGGSVVLIHDVPLAELRKEQLGVVLGNFINLMRTMWAVVMNGAGDANDPASTVKPDDASMKAAIRA